MLEHPAPIYLRNIRNSLVKCVIEKCYQLAEVDVLFFHNDDEMVQSFCTEVADLLCQFSTYSRCEQAGGKFCPDCQAF